MALRGVEVRRVYEDPGRRPGEHRVLVDRLWPRGLAKSAVDTDEWAKELAPTTELRRWFGHDPARFDEFGRRYRAELSAADAAGSLGRLRSLASQHRVVLLTATRDVDHSAAQVLAEVLARTRS